MPSKAEPATRAGNKAETPNSRLNQMVVVCVEVEFRYEVFGFQNTPHLNTGRQQPRGTQTGRRAKREKFAFVLAASVLAASVLVDYRPEIDCSIVYLATLQTGR